MKLFLLLATAATALAQAPVQNQNPCLQLSCFYATQSATVASNGTSTLTIQQPATGFHAVSLIGAVVTCAGQTFSVDQSQNGTAASATAGSAVALVPTTAAASALVFTASNVGSGTAVAPTLPYTSGSIATINLINRTMNVAGTAINYSVKLTNTGGSSCTGTVSIYWMEQQ
jgi:hypothetical protein